MSTLNSRPGGAAAPVVHCLGECEGTTREAIAHAAQELGAKSQIHPSAPAFLESFDPRRPSCLVLLAPQGACRAAVELSYELSLRWINCPRLLAARDDEPLGLELSAAHHGVFDVLRLPRDERQWSSRLGRALTYDREGPLAPSAVRGRLASLSDREREVLDLSLEGKNTDEMAALLGVCYQTINKHRARIRLKMRVKCEITLLRQLIGEPPACDLFGIGRAAPPRPAVSAPAMPAPVVAPHFHVASNVTRVEM